MCYIFETELQGKFGMMMTHPTQYTKLEKRGREKRNIVALVCSHFDIHVCTFIVHNIKEKHDRIGKFLK